MILHLYKNGGGLIDHETYRRLVIDREVRQQTEQRGQELAQWLENTMQEVERLAARHGWDLDDGNCRAGWQHAQTGSRYCELSRERETVDEDGEEHYETQTIKVRVSDHSTCYCREDVSLVPLEVATPDDHTIEDLERILSEEFQAD